MRIVIDLIGENGGCRARIVEPVRYEGGSLYVTANGELEQIRLEQIVDWAPVEIDTKPSLPIECWLPKRAERFICF